MIYIELRHAGVVFDWRKTEDEANVAELVRDLTDFGMRSGDTLAVYESNMSPAELRLPPDQPALIYRFSHD
jgi:hypothetical protein